MSRFTVTNYSNTTEILRVADHYVSMPVTVSDAGVVAVDGKKIVKAGTIVGGASKSVLANPQEPVVAKNTQAGATGTAGAAVDAEGIILSDIDVTYGASAGAMLIHGFVKTSKLPAAPVADAKTALKQIIFTT